MSLTAAQPAASDCCQAAEDHCRGYTKLDDEYLDPEKQKEPDTKEGMYIGWGTARAC